jgi:hypothetical protein
MNNLKWKLKVKGNKVTLQVLDMPECFRNITEHRSNDYKTPYFDVFSRAFTSLYLDDISLRGNTKSYDKEVAEREFCCNTTAKEYADKVEKSLQYFKENYVPKNVCPECGAKKDEAMIKNVCSVCGKEKKKSEYEKGYRHFDIGDRVSVRDMSFISDKNGFNLPYEGKIRDIAWDGTNHIVVETNCDKTERYNGKTVALDIKICCLDTKEIFYVWNGGLEKK